MPTAHTAPTARILNLGILAHVDAGKTTLTERLLFEAGVIGRVGRVDHGDTTTDTDDIERRRGITIRSAVVAFTVRAPDGGEVKVDLIDTPGHSDFVAEVERALRVLDGAVLVVSAVEGVQAHTRRLVRILERLGIPFLVFVNKVDRPGADLARTIAELRTTLAGDAVQLTAVTAVGSRKAVAVPRQPDELREDLTLRLADHDDGVLRRYVEGTPPPLPELLELLGRLSVRGVVHPVYAGSALTGAGVRALLEALPSQLPVSPDDAGAPLEARVFAIERHRHGRVALVRVRRGTLRARDHVAVHHRDGTDVHVGADRPDRVVERVDRVTGVRVFVHGSTTVEQAAVAGDIAAVSGLGDIRIEDQLGLPDRTRADGLFPPPALEAVVRPTDGSDRSALYTALQQLTEQDPLIRTRIDGPDDEVTVNLYGEVQKEVLAARLADDFGVHAHFLPSRVIHVERVSATGEAFGQVPLGNVTVGVRIAPGQVGGGLDYRIAVERGFLLPSFHVAVEEGVRNTLCAGLYGWRVVDCAVTLVESRFCAPTPSAGEFRRLTETVLREAMEKAGTTVCEPISRVEVECPAGSVPKVLGSLVQVGATDVEPLVGPDRGRLSCLLATAAVHELETAVPGLTSGQGIVLAEPAGHRPVTGTPPRRGHPDPVR